jgi:hypothetical protein
MDSLCGISWKRSKRGVFMSLATELIGVRGNCAPVCVPSEKVTAMFT